MRARMMGLAIAGAFFVLSSGVASAALIIAPNGGAEDEAQAEPQIAGGPGFPLNTLGYQHPAILSVDAPGWYRFTYLGAGSALNTNTFTVTGGGTFTAVGPGGTGAGSSAINSFFDVFFASAGAIPFTYTTTYPGSAAVNCTISNGGNSSGGAETCHYLVALENSPGPAATNDPALGPQNVAYIGYSDLPDTDFDFQDLSVRVEALVPAPATLALFGAGLLGLGYMRRRSA